MVEGVQAIAGQAVGAGQRPPGRSTRIPDVDGDVLPG